MQRELPDGSARSQPSSSETISSELSHQSFLARIIPTDLHCTRNTANIYDIYPWFLTYGK